MIQDPNPIASSSQQRSSNQSRSKEEGLITTYLLPKPYPLRPPPPNIPALEPRKATPEPKKKVEHSLYSESDNSDSGRSLSPEHRSTKKDNSSLAEHDANRTANLSEGPFPELLGVVFRDDRWQRDNWFWGMYPRDFWYNERTNSLYPGPLARSMYDWNEGGRRGPSPASKRSWIAVAPKGMPMTVGEGKKLIPFIRRNVAPSYTEQFEVWLVLTELYQLTLLFSSSQCDRVPAWAANDYHYMKWMRAPGDLTYSFTPFDRDALPRGEKYARIPFPP